MARAGLVEAASLDLVEDLAALLTPADQTGALEHDQVLETAWRENGTCPASQLALTSPPVAFAVIRRSR